MIAWRAGLPGVPRGRDRVGHGVPDAGQHGGRVADGL